MPHSRKEEKLYKSNITRELLSTDQILASVQEQYEVLPYPYRNPEDEKTKPLQEFSPSNLFEISYYIYGGKIDFKKPFRVLVAGGGTGDASTYLGARLKEMGCENAEVVHLDLSVPSQKIAAERAKIRGADNVKFVIGSILEADKMGLGKFDYIDSCGVLHHLPEPLEGFRVLSSMLKENGGMGIMVYGEIGRVGVYHMQEMMKMILKSDDGVLSKARMAQRLIKQLPESNWMAKNGNLSFKNREDNEVYDLFCHVKDKAYRTDELCDLLDSINMKVTAFVAPFVYEPSCYINDPEILAKVNDLDQKHRWLFTELLSGVMNKHIFYTIKKSNNLEDLDPRDQTNIPVMIPAVVQNLRAYKPGQLVGSMQVSSGNVTANAQLNSFASYFFHAIDNKRSIKEMYEYIKEKWGNNINADGLENAFVDTYNTLLNLGHMYLSKYPIDVK